MNGNWLEAIPENLHDTAKTAASSAFGATPISAIEPVLGGASGAVAYRVEVSGRVYLVRIEIRRGTVRNPHQYTCMRIAAEAGIAPPLRYADETTGAAIMDFVVQRPLDQHPDGPHGLAKALGKLAANLQATPPFPVLGDFRTFIERMLGYLNTAFAPGLLEPHREVFARIREAYPWDAASHVSSHNDPNPRNILFDGERLWLIDWETAYRNDGLTDVAILVENHATSPVLEEVLLREWLGREPGRGIRARVRLMRQMTRLYYSGLLLFAAGKPTTAIADLGAPTPDEFRRMLATGQLKGTSPETLTVLCKMLLAGFLAGANAPDFEQTLTIVQHE
jgi:aminoglycoside phosphotransferase (APT) family kinase protein